MDQSNFITLEPGAIRHYRENNHDSYLMFTSQMNDISPNELSVLTVNSRNQDFSNIDKINDNFITNPNKVHDMTSDGYGTTKCSSPSSDIVENDDISKHAISPCFSKDLVKTGYDNGDVTVNEDVIVTPDYVMLENVISVESKVIFSSDCVKLVVSSYHGEKKNSFSMWILSDLLHVQHRWIKSVETTLVTLWFRRTSEEGSGNVASGILKLTFSVSGLQWYEKETRIMSLATRYKELWNEPVSLELEKDDDHIHHNQTLLERNEFGSEPFEDVVYPKGDPDAVSISKRDVDLLQPDTFINDTIIDFYVKYLKEKIPPDDRNKFHFFNSFFFRKLADLDKDPDSTGGRAAFLRVHKWTRKVDIFKKDYIFIPVNFNYHWSLIVICHPGEIISLKDDKLDGYLRMPCILHMDSIKGSHKGIKNLIQSYLWEEWKERYQELDEVISSRFLNLRFVSLELPQQDNSFDCGLFLLHYVELFLEDAPLNFNPFKITRTSCFLNMDWFPSSEATYKRSLIQRLVLNIVHGYHSKLSPGNCTNQNNSLKFTENVNEEHPVDFLSEKRNPNKNCTYSDRSIDMDSDQINPAPVSSLGDTQGSMDLDLQDEYCDPLNATVTSTTRPAPSTEEEYAESSEQFVYSPTNRSRHLSSDRILTEDHTALNSMKFDPLDLISPKEHIIKYSPTQSLSFMSHSVFELKTDNSHSIHPFNSTICDIHEDLKMNFTSILNEMPEINIREESPKLRCMNGIKDLHEMITEANDSQEIVTSREKEDFQEVVLLESLKTSHGGSMVKTYIPQELMKEESEGSPSFQQVDIIKNDDDVICCMQSECNNSETGQLHSKRQKVLHSEVGLSPELQP